MKRFVYVFINTKISWIINSKIEHKDQGSYKYKQNNLNYLQRAPIA